MHASSIRINVTINDPKSQLIDNKRVYYDQWTVNLLNSGV